MRANCNPFVFYGILRLPIYFRLVCASLGVGHFSSRARERDKVFELCTTLL